MKILFNTLARNNPNALPDEEKSDYMSDLLFHGLQSLYGEDLTEFPRKDHMYKDYEGDTSKLWGRGFTYSKLLNNIESDRSDLHNQLKNNYYNVVVLSVHHTIHNNPFHLYSTLQYLQEIGYCGKIAVVDGHDLTNGYDRAFQYTPYVFKREIIDENSRFIPISFAIPKEKIRTELSEKKKLLANIVPADHSHPNRRTHVYTSEASYYNDYSESYFALNCKKGGWDAMRPYEIMANGCVPIFTDIELCPPKTLTTLPKRFLSNLKDSDFFEFPKKTFNKNEIDPNVNYIRLNPKNDWTALGQEWCEYCLEYAKTKLTTENLAVYLMNTIHSYRS